MDNLKYSEDFMDSAIRHHLTVPPQLALEFLAVFSRFEFALKITPVFRKTGQNEEAKADWIAFARTIGSSFNPRRSQEIEDSFTYLSAQPLRFLGVKQNNLDWYPFAVPQGVSDAEKVVRLIRQVRNNLFHGGKFMPDPLSDRQRDFKLISASLVLMRELLCLNDIVKAAYDQP